jgi:2,3-bisphosphoglycerate-dependent phosphoglycerate mutase
MRHGESVFNAEKKFTGTGNPPLTKLGKRQAEIGGSLLRGFSFHRIYTSPTERTLQTVKIAAESGGLKIVSESGEFSDVPLLASQNLGPRNYGELQNLSHAEALSLYGPDRLLAYRRGFDTAPPDGESLGLVMERAQFFYSLHVKLDLLAGKDVLMVLHGTGMTAMIAMLGNLSQAEVEKLDPPHCVPHVYEFEVAYKQVEAILEPIEPKLAVQVITPSLTPQLALTANYTIESPLFAQAALIFGKPPVFSPEFAGVHAN